MEHSEMECNTKEKMAPTKPPLSPVSSSKTLNGDAADTSSFPPQAPNENNKVENPPTRNAVSGADPVDDKKQRRIMSNRLSARRSKLRKLSFLANLETQAKTLGDQIAKLEPQEASYQNQKQLLMEEQQTLEQEMEVLQKESLLKDAEIEKHKGEAKRLRELRVMKQDQLQARLLNCNIGLLKRVSNDQGKGVETAYMPPEANMHETNLTLPNKMGSMKINHTTSGTLHNPNFKN